MNSKKLFTSDVTAKVYIVHLTIYVVSQVCKILSSFKFFPTSGKFFKLMRVANKLDPDEALQSVGLI